MERKNAWKKYSDEDKNNVFTFADEYKTFISECKTERECVKKAVELAKKAGYRDLQEIIAANETLKAGDKVYAVNMKKAIVLFNIGSEPISTGMNILGAHIDSPRLDIKQNPMYEDSDLVLLDTHYYGGIKKYQWVAIPLALHGVVALKNGECVEVVIGEDACDAVVGVSDLLIHLAAKQMEKKGSSVVEGEDLDILIGSMPAASDSDNTDEDKEEKEAVKKNILAILKEKYGIEDKLPILIAEKMGPHFAVGDTCYSWAEDTPVFNPDGREIIARDNEISALRKEDISMAYYGCHTDITIPYEELGSISVIDEDGESLPIIENGRFVLPGTEELNKPFEV